MDWNGDINSPIVSILCLAHNYENFISEALDSFLMQKTKFPFEIIVHDDASIDQTPNIIKLYQQKYPQIIKPIFEEENQYSKGGLNIIHKIANKYINGKYLAICDGDDYWIDDHKLQEQCELLELFSQVGVCYSKISLDQRLANLYPNQKEWGEDNNGFDDLLVCNKIPNCTSMIRVALHLKYYEEIKPETKGWLYAEDYAEWLYLSNITQLKYIDKTYSAYRCLSNSLSHNTMIENEIKFERGIQEIRWFFKQRYSSKVHVPSPDEREYYYHFAINTATQRLMGTNKEEYYKALGNMVFSNKIDNDYRIDIAFRILKGSGIKKIIKKFLSIIKNKLRF